MEAEAADDWMFGAGAVKIVAIWIALIGHVLILIVNPLSENPFTRAAGAGFRLESFDYMIDRSDRRRPNVDRDIPAIRDHFEVGVTVYEPGKNCASVGVNCEVGFGCLVRGGIKSRDSPGAYE